MHKKMPNKKYLTLISFIYRPRDVCLDNRPDWSDGYGSDSDMP